MFKHTRIYGTLDLSLRMEKNEKLNIFIYNYLSLSNYLPNLIDLKYVLNVLTN